MILQRFFLFLTLCNVTVDAHFLLADLEDETSSIRVIFAEPGADSMASFLGGRFSKMTQITQNLDRNYINLEEVEKDDEDYFKGSFKSDAPTYVTGFLDFGPFGEGKENPPDLKYTVSAQLFSSNVDGTEQDDDTNAEFENFFHALNDRKYFEGDVRMEGDFRIIMNNRGQMVKDKQSYKVTAFLANSYQEKVSVRVCLYHATSGEKLDCEVAPFSSSSINSTSLYVHPPQALEECTGYYALANTTLTNATDDEISFWSSTYILTPGDNCEEKRHTISNTSFSDHSLTSVSLVFLVAAALGYLSGCILYRFYGRCRKTRHIPMDTKDGFRDTQDIELS